MRLKKDEAVEYGRRGQKKLRQVHTYTYSIEGEIVTIADIAKRVGVGEKTARQRLKRAQGGDVPVTWELLS